MVFMNPPDYDEISRSLRIYFRGKKRFVEVHTQSKLSILAACEDPRTISIFEFGGEKWPLPQTGQMVLEEVLLTHPEYEGVFCVTTSYRNEPHPVKGRHDLIFPMFEFEGRGDFEDLKKTEKELLEHLGFGFPQTLKYSDACEKYGVKILEAEHEEKIQKDYGDVVSLEKFPINSNPFWNMKHCGNEIFNKIDVLLYGMETIGSAERSCNPEEMRYFFENISNGEYKALLFEKFGEKRVRKELDEYLSFKMFPRYGGGIGLTRLDRAIKKKKEKFNSDNQSQNGSPRKKATLELKFR